MKTIRTQFPKVRSYVKSGHTYYQVDLRRKHYNGMKFKNFTVKSAAIDYAQSIAETVSKTGLHSISTTGNEERLQGLVVTCATHGKTIEEAVAVALRVWEQDRATKESPYMAELLSVWVDDKITNSLKPLRPRSIKAIRNNANVFKADFGMTRMKEITKKTVEEYLRGKNVSNQSRKNACSYLSQFFNWAMEKGHHDKNPADKIEITVTKETPKFFNVEQSQAIMTEAVKSEHQHMTAYFALCLFGGIRPEEAERMTWAHLNMDKAEIHLPSSITKTKKDRMFVMSDNLKAWLTTCDKTKLLVPESNMKNHRVRLAKGLTFPWIQDGMRHTFATYHYAKHQSLDKLRFIMGNSPGIIERFYRGAISHTEVEKFWEIRP